MAKRQGKYKLGKHEQTILKNTGGANITLSDKQLVKGGKLGNTGIVTFTGGPVNTNLTDVSADVHMASTWTTEPEAVDLTSVTGDHKVFLNGRSSGSVKLPQATATNAGMQIDVIVASGSHTGSIGFADSGETTLGGSITVHSTNALNDTLDLPAGIGSKCIKLAPGAAADAVKKAGGHEGSIYTFRYQAANTVALEAIGMIGADGTVATTAANVTSSTGLS